MFEIPYYTLKKEVQFRNKTAIAFCDDLFQKLSRLENTNVIVEKKLNWHVWLPYLNNAYAARDPFSNNLMTCK